VVLEAPLSPIERLKIDEAALASVCRRYHVVELLVFGSVARSEAGDTSDVDLLVSFERGAKVTLFTLADPQSELAELLRRPVDPVPKDGLKPAIRGEVLAEAQSLYAA
jgi:predicted nucleotidyltransferase